MRFLFFFFNDTATTEIYTLSLHDALPILRRSRISDTALFSSPSVFGSSGSPPLLMPTTATIRRDRKSTRLNSSHSQISYAVFCLKKKNTKTECQQKPLH